MENLLYARRRICKDNIRRSLFTKYRKQEKKGYKTGYCWD